MLFSCAVDFPMCRLIAVLFAAVAFGSATSACAEVATLDAIIFSSVPVAHMAPQMELYFPLGNGVEERPAKDGSRVLFDAKRCALLIRNAIKPVGPNNRYAPVSSGDAEASPLGL